MQWSIVFIVLSIVHIGTIQRWASQGFSKSQVKSSHSQLSPVQVKSSQIFFHSLDGKSSQVSGSIFFCPSRVKSFDLNFANSSQVSSHWSC